MSNIKLILLPLFKIKIAPILLVTDQSQRVAVL